MRKTFFCIPLLLVAAAVVAQGTPSPEELVTRLGHEDYDVREQATRDLIALGDKAAPALEEALKSDDLEVRLRAGRALRAIRGQERRTEEAEEAGDAPGPGAAPGNTFSSVSIQIAPGKVKVTVKERGEDGEERSKVYEGTSVDELVKEHPELKKHLGRNGTMRFRFGASPDPFDMDEFWKDWGTDLDDAVRKMHEESQRDMERLQRWADMFREQQLERRRLLEQRLKAQQGGAVLGARASRPDEVLDAQLDLGGRGLVLHAIEEGSLADGRGLARFAVLLKLNGKDIRGLADVPAAIEGRAMGEPLTATVIRRGAPRELKSSR